jgi:hypothetical protein
MTSEHPHGDDEFRHSGTTVAVIVFAIMIAGVVYRYWPGEERDIRRHISNLAEALSLANAEGEALSATRFAALREYFAPDVRVRFDGQEIVTRDALLARLRAWSPPPGGVVVDFVDVQIEMHDGSPTADVTLTARISIRSTPAASTAEQRRMTATMVRLEGDWVVASADAGPPVPAGAQTTGGPFPPFPPSTTSFSASFAIDTTLSPSSMSINRTP